MNATSDQVSAWPSLVNLFPVHDREDGMIKSHLDRIDRHATLVPFTWVLDSIEAGLHPPAQPLPLASSTPIHPSSPARSRRAGPPTNIDIPRRL